MPNLKDIMINSKDEKYQSLADDIKAEMTEGVFDSRMKLIETYWNIGKRIREDVNGPLTGGGVIRPLLNKLAIDTGIIRTVLYQAVQFFDKFPTKISLEKLPYGKAISWTKIRTEILPDSPKETKEKKPETKSKQDDLMESTDSPQEDHHDEANKVHHCKYFHKGERYCDKLRSEHPDAWFETVKKPEHGQAYKDFIGEFHRAYRDMTGTKYKFSNVDCKFIKDTMKHLDIKKYQEIMAFIVRKKNVTKKDDFELFKIVDNCTPAKVYSNRNYLIKKTDGNKPVKMDFENMKVEL